MAVKKLPPGLAAHVDRIVEEIARDARARLVEGLRFYGMDTLPAVCELLEENAGEPMSMDDLMARLKQGGIGIQAGASEARGGTDADIKRSIGYFAGRRQQIYYVVETRGKEVIGLVQGETK